MGLILFFALAAFLQGSAATTYNVGDSNGWTFPSDSSAYDIWAAGKTFFVSDILVFNFATGVHDVAEVTKSGYDGCNGNNPISLENTGPASITLTSSGQKYYICTFGSHCSFGQKLSITVSSSTPSSPPPQPATPPMASSPPPASPPATPPPMAASPPPASPPPMVSTPHPASPPPKASSPAPHVSPPTASTPVLAVAPQASTPVPAMGSSPPPTFQTPTPTPSPTASPRSSATPPTTSTGASPPTSVPSTQSRDAPPLSSAQSLGVTSLFPAFLITATAMMIQ